MNIFFIFFSYKRGEVQQQQQQKIFFICFSLGSFVVVVVFFINFCTCQRVMFCGFETFCLFLLTRHNFDADADESHYFPPQKKEDDDRKKKQKQRNESQRESKKEFAVKHFIPTLRRQ